MRLLGRIISFFVLGKNGRNPQVLATNTIYPTDHKLTMQERKALTNTFLEQMGVPTLAHLPLVEDYTTARFRDEREVACRAVILYGLIIVAYDNTIAEAMMAYYKKYNLWRHVSTYEREYLKSQHKTRQDNFDILLRMECVNVLFWSLGHFDTLYFPTKSCDFAQYKTLPDLKIDPTAWIDKSRLRNSEEILNETDLTYRIHWAVRNARVKGQPSPAKINPEIVMERHIALNWLVMYAENWDDISTDT